MCLFVKSVLASLPLSLALCCAQTTPPPPDPPDWLSPASEIDHVLPPWFQFSGEFRTRFEGYTGGSFSPVNSDAYILTRLQLNVTIKPTPWLKFFAQGMDARAIEKAPAIPPYQNTWDFRQAYVEFGSTETDPWGLKVGRQVINLGEQRLVGETPWSNAERTFDAVVGTARYKWQDRLIRLEAFSASVVVPVDGTWDHHLQGSDLHGLYGGLENFIPRAVIEPYIFWRVTPRVKNELGATANTNEKVPGFRWAGTAPKGFDYSTELVTEHGSIGAVKIHAWAGHWNVGHRWNSLWATPRIYAEWNYASGDDNPKDGIKGTFDQLYPTAHDRYGMDDQVGWQNIRDFRAGLETKPRKNVGVNVEYNDWNLASATDALYNGAGTALFRSTTGAYGTHVGQELDFMGTWTVTRNVSLGAGIGHIFPGQFLKLATPGDGYTYPYFMATWKF